MTYQVERSAFVDVQAFQARRESTDAQREAGRHERVPANVFHALLCDPVTDRLENCDASENRVVLTLYEHGDPHRSRLRKEIQGR